MRRFSAQYIITNTGPALKRAVITTTDDGKIISIEDTQGNLKETYSVEFHNGIIIPGFVNCHCHLELSGIKGMITKGEGLGRFIEQIRNNRRPVDEKSLSSIRSADASMFQKGISLCADICNTDDTFDIKKTSRIKYINLLEVFGIDPERAHKRMDEVMNLSAKAWQSGLPYFLTPHSVYSMSRRLMRLLRKTTLDNRITSIHFMETKAEKEFIENNSGPLRESYERSGLMPAVSDVCSSHSEAILNEVTSSGNLILVHNTFIDRNTVSTLKKRDNLYWCLCPGSNMYIENTLPPVGLLREESCEIVIGTDSLASNDKLDILNELIILQENYPEIPAEELIKWATLNGAKALGESSVYGKIQEGTRPGLLLLQNVDLQNMRLLHESSVTRLI